MRKLLSIIISFVFCSGLTSFAGNNDKTIANLKEAFKGETTASAKYAAYSEQAKKEGFTQIAMMFAATSRAEGIHAANHKTVLEKMGQKTDPFKPEFTVKTTKENLDDAINGEGHEILTMYPDFIAKAKEEDAKDAVKSFRWAMDTEKKHKIMYQNVLAALNNNKVATLSKIYWVCPKCGNTYDVANPEDQCSLCATGRSKYIKFDK